MFVSSQFDGGNIECLDVSDHSNILLKIRVDNQSDFYQWFYFRVANVKDLDCRYLITNAAGAAYRLKRWGITGIHSLLNLRLHHSDDASAAERCLDHV